MIFGRFDKYQKRSPFSLPLFYVCAECGSEIRCQALDSGEWLVTCREDAVHDGLKSRGTVSQENRQQAVSDFTDKTAVLSQLAALSPEIKVYVREKAKADKKALYGED